jgi:hypothetical protein
LFEMHEPRSSFKFPGIPLPYGVSSSHSWKWLALAVLVIASFIFVLEGPRECQFRLDTGDVRYLWCGIPVRHIRMSEPERSQLLALGSGSAILKTKWVPCGGISVSLARQYYKESLAWAKQDPHLARLILEDCAVWVTRNHAGLPDSIRMLWYPVIDQNGNGVYQIESDWRSDVGAREYLMRKGYTLVSTTATGPAN